jgi:hypothetical protein
MTKLVLSARDLVRPPSSPAVLAWFDMMFTQQSASQRHHNHEAARKRRKLLRCPSYSVTRKGRWVLARRRLRAA